MPVDLPRKHVIILKLLSLLSSMLLLSSSCRAFPISYSHSRSLPSFALRAFSHISLSSSSSTSTTTSSSQNNRLHSTKTTTPPSSTTSDVITPRAIDYSKWYSDVMKPMAEGSPVRGCMIIKPWGMSIWDSIRVDLNKRIESHDVENAYFPLLIPISYLSKEAQHVDGFAKECAVVTHHRLVQSPADPNTLVPDPTSKLEEPLIIRPTSETIIWSTFRRWIKSHRDLPLKINQWANVVRWELRTRPFLRTSEFLWQEGHTAHATEEGALGDAKDMVKEYADMCTNLLAIPTIIGLKSPRETFAGALRTYTIEAQMQNGWALQSGTSHYLGQNFGKAFDCKFQNEEGVMCDVYGSSWGVSTRLVGALIMTHSDDSGLVLPPRVAPKQVVVVPILGKKGDLDSANEVNDAVKTLVASLTKSGLRVKVDDRDYVRNGAKYYEWERKGVPLCIEIGPRDVKNGVCVMKWRVGDGGKEMVDLTSAADRATVGMDEMHEKLLSDATARLTSGTRSNVTYSEMKEALAKDESGKLPGAGMFLVPWKCDSNNEEKVKEDCKGTLRCYPEKENGEGMAAGKVCVFSGEPATHMALFARNF